MWCTCTCIWCTCTCIWCTCTTFPLVPYNLKGREGDAIQYDTCCSCNFLRSFSGLVPMNLKLRFYKEKIKEEEEKGREEEKEEREEEK